MKPYLPWSLSALLFATICSTVIAEEKVEGDSGKLTIEMIVDNCENKYSEKDYPDSDERNKMIDQCIDEIAASNPTATD